MKRLASLALTAFLFAPCLFAQNSISGVVAAGNQGIAGIRVVLSGAVADTAVTDVNGTYGFTDLPDGDYTLTPESASYTFTPSRLTLTLPGFGASIPVFEATLVTAVAEEVPLPDFLLHPNYPNPFSASTLLSFTLPGTGTVQFDVIDIQGRVVRMLHHGNLSPGPHDVIFDAEGLAPGTYFARLRFGNRLRFRPLLLLR